MRKITLFVLIAVVCIAATILTFYVISQSNIIYSIKYPAQIKVVEKTRFIGINADKDFNFGFVSRGMTASKSLTIKQVSEDAMVQIYTSGEIAGWMVNPNNFIVRKGEEKNISFDLTVPLNADMGNHTGEIFIVLRRIS